MRGRAAASLLASLLALAAAALPQLHHSAQHLASENARLHAALGAAQQQLESAAAELRLRDATLQSVEVALGTVHAAGASAAKAGGSAGPLPPAASAALNASLAIFGGMGTRSAAASTATLASSRAPRPRVCI